MEDLRKSVGEFCSSNRLKINTDLGQHFLINQDILDEIVHAGSIEKEDTIVEIGPGIGILTKELLAKSEKVIAIELDQRLVPLLHAYTGSPDSLTVIHGNALSTDMPSKPYKVIANIPYHITSPLLRHIFIESAQTPQSMTILIQREVAERICDTQNAGILTILVALFGEPFIITNVPSEAFLPPPKVDSAVLHIQCFDKPIASKEIIEEIFRLTKIGFSQKRKMLRNSFSTFPEGLELLERVGIDPQRRPQTLSVDEWIALAKASK